MRMQVLPVVAVLAVVKVGAQAPSARAEIEIGLDAAWQRESAAASPKLAGFRPRCADPAIGVRGAAALQVVTGQGVLVDVALDPARQAAEIFREVEDLRDAALPAGARGVPWGLDFTSATLILEVEVPGGLRDGFAQGFLESENPDGIRSKYYGPAVQIDRAGRTTVRFSPQTQPPVRCDVFVEPFFDLRRVVAVGLKIGQDRLEARSGFSGRIALGRAAVAWRGSANDNNRARAVETPPADDSAVLGKLPPLELPPNAPRVPAADLQTSENSAGGSIVAAHALALDRLNAHEFRVQLPRDRPDATGRSARAAVVLARPLDLLGRTISAYAAIGPGLRGVLTRPAQIQIELYDVDGRVFRGPAESVSGSIRFSPAGVEEASTWVRLEATPFEGDWPQAMGYKAPGFRGEAVERIGIRYERGKHSEALLGSGSAPSGALLLSDFWITSAVTPRAPLDVRRAPLPEAPSPAARPPLPLVGINYAFIGFGTDLGTFPYGDRDVSRGFSAHTEKLARDFDIFCRKHLDLVRVFLLDDLRAGVRYDAAGYVAGLDTAVLPDLNALLEAAAGHGTSLIPVLVDFLAADGAAQSALLNRVVAVGESPLVFTGPEHRRAFIDRALRPVVRTLADANRRSPGLIYAIDIVNEIENARAVFAPSTTPALVDFVRSVRDMIRTEAPGIPVTLGSRDRDALHVWSGLNLDVWQYHFYDKMEEEEQRPLAYPADRLGLNGPVILGEVEPSNVTAKLKTIADGGYDAALFWSWRALDGYVVDLDEMATWKRDARASLGLPPEPDRCPADARPGL
jgi:hypothetical protein